MRTQRWKGLKYRKTKETGINREKERVGEGKKIKGKGAWLLHTSINKAQRVERRCSITVSTYDKMPD